MLKAYITVLALMMFFAAPVMAANVTLTWGVPAENMDGSVYTDPGGYLLTYGVDGDYKHIQLDYNVVQYKLNLSVGQYVIALQAYDSTGNPGGLFWIMVPVK